VTLDKASAWTQIIWGTSAFIVFWVGIYVQQRKVEKKREIEFALLVQTVNTIKERMDKEFGGNSGGVRERINAMSAKIDHIDERTIESAEGLARLTGRFDEHTD